MTKLQKALGVGAVTLTLAMAGAAQATVYTGTCNGDKSCGGATVDLKATVTTVGDQMTIILQNLTSNSGSDGQAISNFEITFDSTSGAPTLFSQSGSLIDIAKSTGAATAVSGEPNHWVVGESGDVLALTTLSGGKPNDLIVGPTPAGGYGPGEASLNEHNPSILETGTFVINFPTGSAVPDISSVQFSLGTSPGDFVNGVPGGTVPEPATWAMMLMGVAGLGGLLRRRRHLALA